jgi:hypothetical protein
MTVTYHNDVVQGSTEWLQMRCGLLTASEMKLIITPTLKIASNEKERAHLYTLLGQRICGYTEDSYEGYDMLRGREDEIDARIKYSENYAPVDDCGFITRRSLRTSPRIRSPTSSSSKCKPAFWYPNASGWTSSASALASPWRR